MESDEPDTAAEPVCSIQRSLEILGQKWAFLIVRNALRGTTKFSELHKELGVPKDVLSARLSALVEAGVFTRESYRDAGSRERWQYRLTERGEELKVVLAALQQWGETHRPSAGVPGTYVQDRDGGSVRVTLAAEDGSPLGVDEVHLVSAEQAHRINGSIPPPQRHG